MFCLAAFLYELFENNSKIQLALWLNYSYYLSIVAAMKRKSTAILTFILKSKKTFPKGESLPLVLLVKCHIFLKK